MNTIYSLFTQTQVHQKKKNHYKNIPIKDWISEKKLSPTLSSHIIHLNKSNVQCMITYYDNTDGTHIFYEFLVGEYVNLLHTFLPCFIYTYEIIEFNESFNELHSSTFNQMKTIDDLSYSLTKCSNNNGLALLHEYNGGHYMTFQEYLANNKLYELNIILFQIYICLAYLDTAFTHNDLSYNNIRLYKLPHNQYITLIYQQPSESITIKSSYIVKIINYKNSYFYRDTSCNSNTIANLLINKTNSNIPITYNKSIDLLLAYQLQIDKYLLCPTIVYTGQCNDLYANKIENNIYTVFDLYLYLKCYLENNDFLNSSFNNKINQATITVSMDDSEENVIIVA